jgi:hypothetical protein
MNATPAAPITKAGIDVVVQSGNAAIAGFQELARAYQALATRSAQRLGTSLEALSAIKSPSELLAVQGQLMRDAVDAAVKDSANIARLTAAVFTAAFEPLTRSIAVAPPPTQV